MIDIEVLIVIFLFVCTVVFFNLDSIASELEEIVDKLIQNDESEI